MAGITNVYLLVFLLSMMAFLKEFITGLTSISIPAIERQFSMPSKQSALIPASNEIAATVLVLLVVFIGSHVNRVRCLAVGTFVMGLGCVVYIVPHWLEAYTPTGTPAQSSSSSLCNTEDTHSTIGRGECGKHGNALMLGLFIAAQMVVGIGYIPLITLGHSYIYDNAEPSKTPIFIGILFAGSNIGQACGFFGAGAIAQNVFVDFDRQRNTSGPLSPSSAHWVGAWWLGFVPAALLAVCVAVPLCFYPSQLKDTKPEPDVSERADDNSKEGNMCHYVLLFLKTGLNLSRNPVFVFTSLGVCAANMVLFGFVAYVFKYIVTIYNASLLSTAIYLGVTILLGAIGVILSGVLIRCLKLEVVGMLRMNVIVAMVTAVMGLVFLAKCPDVVLAGGDTSGSLKVSQLNTTWSCNSDCRCYGNEFSPVCGDDDQVYLSPCIAGCQLQTSHSGKTSFGNCSCIHPPSGNGNLPGAIEGFCDSGCKSFWIFAPCLVFMVIVLLMVQPSSTLAILRSVDEKSRDLSLGIRKIMLQVLGFIPGPLIVGAIFDSSCRLWDETNCPSSEGECMIYDDSKLSVRVGIFAISVSALGGLLFFIASICASRSKKTLITAVPMIQRARASISSIS